MNYRSVSMKPLRLLLIAGALAASACVSQREPAPQLQPQPPVRRPVQQQLPPPPPPAAEDWRDMPLTPGGWSYGNQGMTSQALFGAAGSASFIVRCDRSTRRVTLARKGAAAASMMVVRTTSTSRSLPVAAEAEPGFISTTLTATDPLLDAIAFSRGRFTVEAQGLPMLVIPAWPEPARVVEDCRG